MSKFSQLRTMQAEPKTAFGVALGSMLLLLGLSSSNALAQSSWQSGGGSSRSGSSRSEPAPRAESAEKTEKTEKVEKAEKAEPAEQKAAKSSKKTTGSETKNGVTVEKNSDGTVDAYDAGESAAGMEDSAAGSGGTNASGQYTGIVNGVRYRPGTSPYSRSIGGVSTRRNSDGSIETSDEVEVHHWVGSPSGGAPHRASHARKGKSSGHSSSSKASSKPGTKKSSK